MLHFLDESMKHTGEILLAIPGYLSEGDDHKDNEWKYIERLAQITGKTLVKLQWPAKKMLGLFTTNGVVGTSFAVLKYAMRSLISLPLSFAIGFGMFTYQNKQEFSEVKTRAEIVGQLIGCLLAIGYPFMGMPISIVCFSLGTHVAHHIMLTLNELGCSDLISNVTLLGGATSFPTKEIELYEDMFSKLVAGKIVNVHSQWD